MLLLTTAALQIGAHVVLRAFGLPSAVRAARLIGSWSRGVDDLRLLEWALAASASRVRGTCLTQALTALALGASTRLVIGARRGAPIPEFHAWAETRGVALPATPDLATFTPVRIWN